MSPVQKITMTQACPLIWKLPQDDCGVKCKTYKRKSLGTRFMQRVFRIDSKSTVHLKIDKFYSSDWKRLFYKSSKSEKKKVQNRRKYFQNIASDKGLLWTMYKELSTQQLEIPVMQLKSRKKCKCYFM